MFLTCSLAPSTLILRNLKTEFLSQKCVRCSPSTPSQMMPCKTFTLVNLLCHIICIANRRWKSFCLTSPLVSLKLNKLIRKVIPSVRSFVHAMKHSNRIWLISLVLYNIDWHSGQRSHRRPSRRRAEWYHGSSERYEPVGNHHPKSSLQHWWIQRGNIVVLSHEWLNGGIFALKVYKIEYSVVSEVI